jgi:hypothetical protein
MTRVKGFAQEVAEELMASGELHTPNLRRLHQPELYGDTPEDMHLRALQIGIPVVAEAFRDSLRVSSSFEAYPAKTIESRRSAHGVSFGRFLGWRNGKLKTTLNVAIKPFDDPETALHEMYGYRTLQGLDIETFDPVAVFPASVGSHYVMMTETRKDLQSLDRDIWIPGRRVISEETAAIAERNATTVAEIAETMAFMHANGVFHPDGQIKNWAVTTEGTIGVIDTENLKQLDPGHQDSEQLAWQDITKLVKSLILETKDDGAKLYGVGMLGGMALEQVRECLQSLVVLPYAEKLMELSEGADEERRASLQKLFDGIMNNFFGEENWPRHFIDSQHMPYEVRSKA